MDSYEINKILAEFSQTLTDLSKALDLNQLNQNINVLEQATLKEDFWQNPQKAKSILQTMNSLTKKKTEYQSLVTQLSSIENLNEDLKSLADDELMTLLVQEIKDFKTKIEAFEIHILLSEEYDAFDAILELHPGAGGVESMDWCEMLYRMYTRFIASNDFKYDLIDYQSGEEAGIKSATIKVKGEYAYGLLKAERGVHRLVRISPFDSNARRHTSFVSVDVMPVLDAASDIIIKDEDLKIDVYRSSGAGGQSVNTTDSAVRITHLPTNTVVTCQNERSQIKNKETALEILKSKLLLMEIQAKEEELQAIKGEKKDIGWGSQIRSYVFQPYQMVKDHRTNFEVGNVQAVMDGDISGFIYSYLKESANEKSKS